MLDLVREIAKDLSLKPKDVRAALALLDQEHTVPFIVRYRQSEIGAISASSLREVARLRLSFLALAKRKKAVILSLEKQGLLSKELSEQISKARTLADLEEIYKIYRPERKTRAAKARELGLEQLARLIVNNARDEEINKELALLIRSANPALNKEVALSGAVDIIAGKIAENIKLLARLKEIYWQEARLISKAKVEEDSVYALYFDFSQELRRLASHQVLALFRGERVGALRLRFFVDEALIFSELAQFYGLSKFTDLAFDFMKEALGEAYQRLLAPSLARFARKRLLDLASKEALKIFAVNLKSALLAKPLESTSILALDPGFRHGCKWAMVDSLGALLEAGVIYPTPPRNDVIQSRLILGNLIRRYQPDLLVLGNGTASYELEQFVSSFLADKKLDLPYLIVNESGASVYSASDLASAEFPELDPSLRSAISLARRVQDPLAELVKIAPASIGLGQYQHDLNQKELEVYLAEVVEDCVNLVGVNVNTASVALLSYVAGLSQAQAQAIFDHRKKYGLFKSRTQLLEVKGIGPLTFLQAAGFLRISGGKEPLDNTAIHPESYDLVRELQALLAQSLSLGEIAKRLKLSTLELKQYLDQLASAPEYKSLGDLNLSASLREISSLKVGQKIKGVVSNIAAFGLFVDIGVGQAGLVHVSKMGQGYVKNPAAYFQVGDCLEVKVIGLDLKKKRISLAL